MQVAIDRVGQEAGQRGCVESCELEDHGWEHFNLGGKSDEAINNNNTLLANG